MQTVLHDIRLLPLWAQILLIATLLLVGNFWLMQLSRRLITLPFLTTRWWHLLKLTILAAGLSFIAVSYWMGPGPTGQYGPWNIYARGGFVVLTSYLTTLFTRYFPL